MDRKEMHQWYKLQQEAYLVLSLNYPGGGFVDWSEFLEKWQTWMQPRILTNTEIDCIGDNIAMNDIVIWTNRT